jgi:heavy metal sensor kinase
MIDSVRTRLTLWYAGVLAVSLIAFAVVIYYTAVASLHERQDESLKSTAQTVASAYEEELQEQQSISKAGQIVMAELIFPNRYVQIIDSAGHQIATSKNASEMRTPIPEAVLTRAREHNFDFLTADGFRFAVVPISSDRPLGFAAVAEPLSVIEEGLSRLRRDFFAGVPVVLLVASLGGYFLARKSLSSISSMSAQTQRISAESLSSRLDVTNPRDELGRLATTINDLLARLENAFNEQQRFIADASHELRTPLAVLRGETEVALEKTRTVDEYQDSLSLIKDEAERLSRIVEDLFILARQPVDAPAKLVHEQVVLNDAVRDCARAAQVLATRKGVQLNVHNNNPPIALSGDEDLLKRMILNLLDNAVKYTPAGGEISLTLERQNGNAQIVVRDTGIGISEQDQLRVFDRFYRVDKARSRALGGAGLGLSIVRWIVDAHGGKIQIHSSDGIGSVFTVELPLRHSATARR